MKPPLLAALAGAVLACAAIAVVLVVFEVILLLER